MCNCKEEEHRYFFTKPQGLEQAAPKSRTVTFKYQFELFILFLQFIILRPDCNHVNQIRGDLFEGGMKKSELTRSTFPSMSPGHFVPIQVQSVTMPSFTKWNLHCLLYSLSFTEAGRGFIVPLPLALCSVTSRLLLNQ